MSAKSGFIAFILFILLTCSRKDIMELNKYIPEEINGWEKAEKDRIFDRETIFDYMDGAGEVYLMFSFKKMLVRRFVKPEQPDITVEIFDMGSSKDAFGIFSNNREDEKAGFGQGYEYRGGVLYFWKGHYLVSIFPEDETEESKNTVTDIAKKIDNSITEKGEKPEILKFLPEENLIKNRTRYFHKFETLNYHYYLSEKNILNLDENTEAVFAQYKDKSYLFYARYPDEVKANNALENFLTYYIPEEKEKKIARIENGKWVACKVVKNYVAIVFDSPEKNSALKLLENISFEK